MRTIMRILLSSLLGVFVNILCLFLPTTSATPHARGADRGIQVNDEVAKGSGDKIKAGSQASFLSPLYIPKSIQNTYLPSALRVTGAIQAFVAPDPSPSDILEKAKKCEKMLQDYIPRLLKDAAAYFKSPKFTDITSNMHHIVNATATFRDNIKDALDAHGVTFDNLTEELEGIFMGIANNLKNISSPDKAPGHAERAEMVDKVLDDTSLALINLAKRYGIEEQVVTTYILALKPRVQALTVAVGDINEQHPDLFPALAFSVSALLIPQSWILRPFLSVFGFGPAGPVKGSAAAWMQRRFWGATVRAGSWFSLLQKAGMGVYPKWGGFVTKVRLVTPHLLALLPRFKRRQAGRIPSS